MPTSNLCPNCKTHRDGGGDCVCPPSAFPRDDTFTAAFQEMFTDLRGFVYPGDSLNAMIDMLKWLRLNPEKASVLLG